MKFFLVIFILSMASEANSSFLNKQAMKCCTSLFINNRDNKVLRDLLSSYLGRKALIEADIATGGLNDENLMKDIIGAAQKARVRVIASNNTLAHADALDLWQKHKVAALLTTEQDHQRLSTSIFKFKGLKNTRKIAVIHTPHLTRSGLNCDTGVVISTKSVEACTVLQQMFDEFWDKLVRKEEDILGNELAKEIELFKRWQDLFKDQK